MHLILLPLCLGDDCRLSLSFSQNFTVLVAPPLLSAWLLANQRFIKPLQVTNLYRVQTIVHSTTSSLGEERNDGEVSLGSTHDATLWGAAAERGIWVQNFCLLSPSFNTLCFKILET